MTLSPWHVHLAVLSQRACAKGAGLRCQTWLIMGLKTVRGTHCPLGFDLNCPAGVFHEDLYRTESWQGFLTHREFSSFLVSGKNRDLWSLTHVSAGAEVRAEI